MLPSSFAASLGHFRGSEHHVLHPHDFAASTDLLAAGPGTSRVCAVASFLNRDDAEDTNSWWGTSHGTSDQYARIYICNSGNSCDTGDCSKSRGRTGGACASG